MRPMNILSLFFFLFLHHCFLSNTQNFSSNISICGNLTIQYPFQLQSQNTQQNPNYISFSLSCTDQGNTLLNIPFSGDFLVQEINYTTKELKLQNPSNCLPRKLLHLNLFSSPPFSSSSQNYTFSLLSDFRGDLRLSWDVHLDKFGDSNMTNRETSTADTPRTGRTSRKEIILIFFVGAALILPSVLCLICVSCRIYLELSHRRQVAAATAAEASIASLVPVPMIVIEGLDESTIQSYRKVVLGESRRIPGINVMICAICLGEYSAGETLRCIPECEHCFHVECVDKWLKMNSTCPVCRNSLHS
ncbi:hypothetical protein HAX54_011593 [Datura stramonium]|uniref:RING-type E3 ubiquitin transferase n=1 Tax=Datura stramonium TaxID=4076 RepID=A0ABS8TK43_DATST|nr:hypothetical protein [Datura stramonium]